MKKADIAKLRVQLERDLEALNRVEELLKRHASSNGQVHTFVQAADLGFPRHRRTGRKGALKKLCIAVLREAGPNGMRPKDLVQACVGRGYQFRSVRGAAGSVSTVLKRLAAAGQVTRNDGLYVWKGKAMKLET